MATSDSTYRATCTLTTRSPAETQQLGERLGKHLQSGDLLCLSGNLGAGKTCLARGLAHGWGASERPTSPTFILVNEYHRTSDSQRFFHLDCYRLAGVADALSVGLEDMLGADGVLVIEWPERIADILPAERLWVRIQVTGDESRAFDLLACGPRAVTLQQAAQQSEQ